MSNPLFSRLLYDKAGWAFAGCMACLMLLSSCDGNRYFEENRAMPDETWDVNNTLRFEVPVDNTNALYNFFLNVRHTGQYPYRNLFLFVDSEFPDGSGYRDTLECALATKEGRWYGDGVGDLRDLRIQFKMNTVLPDTGTYVFSFEQAMREEHLPHIKDVGLRIEKAD